LKPLSLFELRQVIFGTREKCLKVILSETTTANQWKETRTVEILISNPVALCEHWKISGAKISPSEREINLRDYYYYFTCPVARVHGAGLYKNLISITGETIFSQWLARARRALHLSCMTLDDKSFSVSLFQ
jgi:hypothetical protein